MEKECEILRKSSLYIRNWNNNQPRVKEESITDWLLFNISNKTNKIFYRDFTRHEESRNGADWEWWFLFPKFSYKFRIQAKKIKTNQNNHSSITYPKNTSGQLKKLIADAGSCNAIPLYAFYTNKINRVGCNQKILDEGVYLTSARMLQNKFIIPKITKIEYDDILENTTPLSCLICCPLHSQNGNDNGLGFENFLKDYYNLGINGNNEIPGKYFEIPEYVNILMELSQENLPEGWERDFIIDNENLNGIIIFDRR